MNYKERIKQMGPENIEKVREIFKQPIETVAQGIATASVWHKDRKKVLPGSGAIFALQTETGMRRFRLEEAILYDHDYTMQRWPNTRGPQIAGLEPATIIAYQFHQYALLFAKFGDFGSAANIQLDKFAEVNGRGESLQSEKANIGGAKLSQLVGLRHRDLAYLTLFDFQGQQAFLLSAGTRRLSPAEIQRLEEEIFSL